MEAYHPFFFRHDIRKTYLKSLLVPLDPVSPVKALELAGNVLRKRV